MNGEAKTVEVGNDFGWTPFVLTVQCESARQQRGIFHPKGMKIIQPSVDATAATLGIRPAKSINPERVESITDVSSGALNAGEEIATMAMKIKILENIQTVKPF